MNFRAMTAAALTGACCLVFAVIPDSSAGADSTTTQAVLTTQSKTTNEGPTAAAGQVESGVIRNGFISYKEEPTACFNHEASGGQFTLATRERGAIAQLFYGVTYDGKKAAYRHEADEAPLPDGFDAKTTHSSDSRRITTEVRSWDGAVVVRTESTCGKGPYVIRQMRVTNTSNKRLGEVRLLLTVNPDTLDWENEIGRVDGEAAQVLVHNPAKTEWVGIAAQPKPAYLTADDVMSILDAEAGSDWSQPSRTFTGNVAVQAGWQLGPLEPGQSKTVEATFATTANENDLRKALTRQAFPDR